MITAPPVLEYVVRQIAINSRHISIGVARGAVGAPAPPGGEKNFQA